jgi:hypothetical protein
MGYKSSVPAQREPRRVLVRCVGSTPDHFGNRKGLGHAPNPFLKIAEKTNWVGPTIRKRSFGLADQTHHMP